MGKTEPLAVRGAIVAVASSLVQLLVVFGVPLTTDQTAALLSFINVASIAAVVIWSRGRITPVAHPRDDEGNALVPLGD